MIKKLIPALKQCPFCQEQYRSMRPHCGSIPCHKQHRTAVRDLWESRNDIRASHNNACQQCTFILDQNSIAKGYKYCEACRIIKLQKKRESRAKAKDNKVIEKNADEAAVRITLLEFERRQQKAFSAKEPDLSFLEQKTTAPKYQIPLEEA